MFYPVARPLITSGFYSFFSYLYPEEYYFEGEHHPFWEVSFCLDGAAGVSADDKVYRLNPGDMIVHRPHVYHKLWAEKKTFTHVLTISFDAEGEVLDQLDGAYSCGFALQEQWRLLNRMIGESGCPKKLTGYLRYLEKRPREFQRVTNLFESCLLTLADEGLPLGFNHSENALHYERIIRTMKNNIGGNLSIHELGRECGLSASSMKKIFSHYNSMGIHKYYLHLKMEEAVRLLTKGHTVTEVADLLGFANQSYFSTVFKREMKENPARFKPGRR